MGFSVLMSVYQKEKPEYLRQALRSVMHQTLKPQENRADAGWRADGGTVSGYP